MTNQEYVEMRVMPRLAWYDKRAQRNKRIHVALDYAAMTGSVSLVFLLHVEYVPRVALAGIATLITLAVAIDRVGRFGELWPTYRLAAEALSREIHLFNNGAGPYQRETDRSQLLVERVEDVLAREAEKWGREIDRQPPPQLVRE